MQIPRFAPDDKIRLFSLDAFDRAIGGLEADFAVRAIAKWPIRAARAATQGKGNLARQVVFIAVSIHEFNNAIGIVDPQRAVLADSNRNLGHETSG
jgi:hypothetical protein